MIQYFLFRLMPLTLFHLCTAFRRATVSVWCPGALQCALWKLFQPSSPVLSAPSVHTVATEGSALWCSVGRYTLYSNPSACVTLRCYITDDSQSYPRMEPSAFISSCMKCEPHIQLSELLRCYGRNVLQRPTRCCWKMAKHVCKFLVFTFFDTDWGLTMTVLLYQ